MCLAYPMTIVEIDGMYAQVEVEGVRRRVGLALLPEAEVGDEVLVHAGYAISAIDPEEAEETRRIYKELWAIEDAERARDADGEVSEE
jgi:hydrogenase expression/formation protein HypC